jgi:exosortase A-associated hydrolase 1
MSIAERAVVFSYEADRLLAIISLPQRPLPRGVLIVVGGPQYRAGSHRQFTLLCRALAEHGIAAMRFDYRGMGDSEGEVRSFENITTDIRTAIDQFCMEVPGVREVVIWGLCDAASAALFYAHGDVRVTGLVLLNPWVRTSAGIAKAQLKHYYGSRFTDREFWRKVARGEFSFATSLASFASALRMAIGMGVARTGSASREIATASGENVAAPLPERMADGFNQFKGKVLIIVSGNDLTAQEFEGVARESSRWRRLLSDTRVEYRKLPNANHTFSTREWRDQVAAWTSNWVQSW